MQKIRIDLKIVVMSIVITLVKVFLGDVLETNIPSYWISMVLADYNVCSNMVTVQLIIYVIEYICLFYVVVIEIIDTLRNKSVFIFTRIDKRKKFLLNEYMIMTLKIVMYYMISVMVMIGAYLISGGNISSVVQMIWPIAVVIACKVCYQVLILGICIICGLYWDEMYIMCTYLVVKLVSILSVYSMNKSGLTNLIKWNILLQDMYTLKKYEGNNEVLKNIYYTCKNGSNNIMTLIGILIMICVVKVVGARLYERKDFI